MSVPTSKMRRRSWGGWKDGDNTDHRADSLDRKTHASEFSIAAFGPRALWDSGRSHVPAEEPRPSCPCEKTVFYTASGQVTAGVIARADDLD